TCRHHLVLLADLRIDDRLDQVVTDGRGDGQQQTGSRGQRRRDGTCCDQTDDPARQVGDFRVGQYDDVVVDGQLVAVPAALLRSRSEGSVGVVVHLNTTIVVLVFKLDQTGFFPGLDPARTRFVLNRLGRR